MHRLIQILVVDSIRDLIRFKSFFLLVALLLIADRVLQSYVKIRPDGFEFPSLRELEIAADWLFIQAPNSLSEWLLDWRTLLIGGCLFAAKQLTSMWPTMDMRKMHRSEGGRWRILKSLQSLRWSQFTWDACAVVIVVGIGGVWAGTGWTIGREIWIQSNSPFSLLFPVGMVGVIWPLGMAGFSYSSKLAVLSNGFPTKLKLFSELLKSRRVFWYSWLFYLARILISLLFVLLIPILSLLTVENFFIRILIASISAAPAYSYVKMASFKFFLEVYRPYPEVVAEYQSYYSRHFG